MAARSSLQYYLPDAREGEQEAKPPGDACLHLVKGGDDVVVIQHCGGEGRGGEVPDGGAWADREVLEVQLAHLDCRQDHSQSHHLHCA